MSIIYDMPWDEYRKMDGMNQSRLKKISRAPREFAYSEKNQEDTKAMRWGRILHEYILTPDLFDYYLTDKIRRAGKPWIALIEDAKEKGYAEDEILFREELKELEDMKNAIYKHPVASKIIQSSKKEVTITWKEKEFGVDCKARLDLVKHSSKGILITDLKTCKDSSLDGFTRSVFCEDYRYDIQGAFYSDGYQQNVKDENINYCFIAIEKTPPYLVGIYTLGTASYMCGKCAYLNLLHDYDNCTDWETDLNDNELKAINPPNYFLNKYSGRYYHNE